MKKYRYKVEVGYYIQGAGRTLNFSNDHYSDYVSIQYPSIRLPGKTYNKAWMYNPKSLILTNDRVLIWGIVFMLKL